jgi:hypothetical protein
MADCPVRRPPLLTTSSAAVTASLPMETLSAPARKYRAATSTADQALPEGSV